MSQNSDGTFKVVCEGDYVENNVTKEQIVSNQVCTGSLLPLEDVRIAKVDVMGNGCSPFGTEGTLSEDFSKLSLGTAAMTAFGGLNASLDRINKRCTTLIDLDVPMGWSYAISGVKYHYYVSLENEVEAVLHTKIEFSGTNSERTVLGHSETGQLREKSLSR